MSFCGLIKGISPKIYILCARVKINKHSFKPFCVWILFQIFICTTNNSTSQICVKQKLLITIKPPSITSTNHGVVCGAAFPENKTLPQLEHQPRCCVLSYLSEFKKKKIKKIKKKKSSQLQDQARCCVWSYLKVAEKMLLEVGPEGNRAVPHANRKLSWNGRVIVERKQESKPSKIVYSV